MCGPRRFASGDRGREPRDPGFAHIMAATCHVAGSPACRELRDSRPHPQRTQRGRSSQGVRNPGPQLSRGACQPMQIDSPGLPVVYFTGGTREPRGPRVRRTCPGSPRVRWRTLHHDSCRPDCFQVASVKIRPLAISDVAAAAPLLTELGYPTDADSFAARIASVAAGPDDAILVAEDDGRIVGLVSVHSFEMLHRPGRLGRITSLVVTASARNRGIGSQLLHAAEDRLRADGCVRLEVTSGEHRPEAHGFYAAHGYKAQPVRFVKDSAA